MNVDASMDKDGIFSELKRMMVEIFELDAGDVTLEANLRDELDLDSIDAVDMAVKLEGITGQRVGLNTLRRLRTVSDVVDVVHAQLQTAQ